MILTTDATPFEPVEQVLSPLAELLARATLITTEQIPDWGESQNWEYDESNLDGVSPGWNASAEDIESVLDDERSQAAREVATATEELIEDEELNRWEDAVASILLLLLLGSYGLGKGGRPRISASDLVYLQNRFRNQLTFLRQFSEAILQGQLSANQVRARAGYYSSDGRLGYDEGFRSGYLSSGWQWERNVLAIAEHCPGCLEATAMGWQPIGTLSPLGSRQCKFNELCHWEFSNSIERPTDSVGLRSFVVQGWGWL